MATNQPVDPPMKFTAVGDAEPKYYHGATRLKKTGSRTLNCDQVAWLLDVFQRYLPRRVAPGVSREHEMLKYGMLYEVMEVANLGFEDASARHNGTPPDARIPDTSGDANNG